MGSVQRVADLNLPPEAMQVGVPFERHSHLAYGKNPVPVVEVGDLAPGLALIGTTTDWTDPEPILGVGFGTLTQRQLAMIDYNLALSQRARRHPRLYKGWTEWAGFSKAEIEAAHDALW